MDTNYIGSPTNFRRIEGSEINYRHTFDLNGTQNDEMLRLYLRSAGLSDEIECLTAEQRRAFIYDIIRSNKLPGYWLPSTLQNSNNTMQRPSVRPPPPPMPTSATPSPYAERKNQNSSPALSYATMRSTASSSSLQSLDHASPIMPQRFIPAPVTPPSPTSFITSARGNRYEISGPMNFQHTAGDMTRDRTRNAFDLSASNNDNVLRKYMMERGITEEDVAGMRKADIIRKIVQSKFTWMPNKHNNNTKIEQKLVYATVSRNNNNSTPSSPSYEELSPATTPSPKPSPPATLGKSKTDFSNYTLVTSRFADSSQFPAPSDLFGNKNEATTVALPPLPPNAKRPAPPPRKSQHAAPLEHVFHEVAPPPPATIKAQAQDMDTIYKTRIVLDYDNAVQRIPIQGNNNASQQNMQYNTFRQPTEPLYVTTAKQTSQKPRFTTNIPAPPAPPQPPQPPQSPQPTNMIFANKMPQPAFNVQNGNTMQPNFLSAENARVKSPPPPPPIKKSNTIVPTPPPPPPPISAASAAVPPPPPPPAMSAAGAAAPPPPPPPPLMIGATATSQPTFNNEPAPKQNAALAGDDGRDALLESIRKGVSLKKVNQKAATISGVKPRAERKPPATDFLSELKLGITLRRIKNPEDNPFAADEFDESTA